MQTALIVTCFNCGGGTDAELKIEKQGLFLECKNCRSMIVEGSWPAWTDFKDMIVRTLDMRASRR